MPTLTGEGEPRRESTEGQVSKSPLEIMTQRVMDRPILDVIEEYKGIVEIEGDEQQLESLTDFTSSLESELDEAAIIIANYELQRDYFAELESEELEDMFEIGSDGDEEQADFFEDKIKSVKKRFPLDNLINRRLIATEEGDSKKAEEILDLTLKLIKYFSEGAQRVAEIELAKEEQLTGLGE